MEDKTPMERLIDGILDASLGADSIESQQHRLLPYLESYWTEIGREGPSAFRRGMALLDNLLHVRRRFRDQQFLPRITGALGGALREGLRRQVEVRDEETLIRTIGEFVDADCRRLLRKPEVHAALVPRDYQAAPHLEQASAASQASGVTVPSRAHLARALACSSQDAKVIETLLTSVMEESRALPFHIWVLLVLDKRRTGSCCRLSVSLLPDGGVPGRRRSSRNEGVEVIGPGACDRSFLGAARVGRDLVERILGRSLSVRIWLPFHLGGLSVDGPSAGLPIALAILARHAGRRIGLDEAGDTAVTGAIDVHGRVGAVGGMEQKLQAIIDHNEGGRSTRITHVLIPKENMPEAQTWLDRRRTQRRTLSLRAVESLDQAIAAAVRDPFEPLLTSHRNRHPQKAPAGLSLAVGEIARESARSMVLASSVADPTAARQRRTIASSIAAELSRRRLQRKDLGRSAKGGDDGVSIQEARGIPVPIVVDGRLPVEGSGGPWSIPGDMQRSAREEWDAGGLLLIVTGVDLDTGSDPRMPPACLGPGGVVQTFLTRPRNRALVVTGAEEWAFYQDTFLHALGNSIQVVPVGRPGCTLFNPDRAPRTAWLPVVGAADHASQRRFFLGQGRRSWMETKIEALNDKGQSVQSPPVGLNDLIKAGLRPRTSRGRTILVLGDPGSGKSTLLQRLLHEMLADPAEPGSDGTAVPWYLHAGALEHWIDPNDGWGPVRIDLASCFPGTAVLIDALNEIPESGWEPLADNLAKIHRSIRSNRSGMLVLFSRPEILTNGLLAYLGNWIPEFHVELYGLLPPSPGDIARFGGRGVRYLDGRFRLLLEPGELKKPLTIALLRLFAEGKAGEGPHDVRQSDLLATGVRTVLENHVAQLQRSHRPMEITDRPGRYLDNVQFLLQIVALHAVEQGITQIPVAAAARALQDCWEKRPDLRPHWPSFQGEGAQPNLDFELLVRKLASSGILHDATSPSAGAGIGVLSFLHESFRDQLAAEALAEGWEAAGPVSAEPGERWRVALEWSRERGTTRRPALLLAEQLVKAIGEAVDPVHARFLFEAGEIANDLGETGGALRYLESCLAVCAQDAQLRSRAAHLAGEIQRRLGSVPESNRLFIVGLRTARALGDGAGMIRALDRLRVDQARLVPSGSPVLTLDELSQAYEEATALISRQGGDPVARLQATFSMAGLYRELAGREGKAGRLDTKQEYEDRAREMLRHVHESSQDSDNLTVRQLSHWALSSLCYKDSTQPDPDNRLGESFVGILALCRRSQDPGRWLLHAQTGRDYASWLQARGRLGEVEEQLRDALAAARRIRHNEEMRLVGGYLATLLMRLGRFEEADPLEREHLDLSRAAQIPGGIMSALFTLGQISLRARRPEEFAPWHALAEEEAGRHPEYLKTHRGLVAALRQRILDAQREILAGRLEPALEILSPLSGDGAYGRLELFQRVLLRLATAEAAKGAGNDAVLRAELREVRALLHSREQANQALWAWELRKAKSLARRN